MLSQVQEAQANLKPGERKKDKRDETVTVPIRLFNLRTQHVRTSFMKLVIKLFIQEKNLSWSSTSSFCHVFYIDFKWYAVFFKDKTHLRHFKLEVMTYMHILLDPVTPKGVLIFLFTFLTNGGLIGSTKIWFLKIGFWEGFKKSFFLKWTGECTLGGSVKSRWWSTIILWEKIKIMWYFNYTFTRTSGAYGPLVLAPVEGLGALRAPCQVWVIYLILWFCLFDFLYFFSSFFVVVIFYPCPLR